MATMTIDPIVKTSAKRKAPSKKKEGPTDIIDALDKVQEGAKDSKLSDKFWKKYDKEFTYLTTRLGLTKEESLIIAVMCEIGEAVSWKGLSRFFGISRLRTMALTPAMEALKQKRWICSYAVLEHCSRYQGFKLIFGVITALRENRPYVPEKIDGLTEQQFVERLGIFIADEASDNNLESHEKNRMLLQLVEANPDLPICKCIAGVTDINSKVLLLLLVGDYTRFANTPTEGLLFRNIMEWFDNPREGSDLLDSLREEQNELFTEKLIEFKCRDGLADPDVVCLTDFAKKQLLSEYSPKFNKTKRPRPDVIKFDSIKEKKLYFNDSDIAQIDRLHSVLNNDTLSKIRERLSEAGMRQGIACLFYGSPGTGKTESALQLARLTGRDVMQVDISAVRDKFVGESEKNIRGLFARYNDFCKECDVTPILLFNEADAIFGNRFESVRSSVEKMDNTIQNIILEEMEKLDGILIATTNLTGNLDKAFDRRFLFKIEFKRPDKEVRKSIWQSLMPDLDSDLASTLAGEFDLSGGQIENVARKSNIEYIISGNEVSLSQMRTFCLEERLNRCTHNRIGF